MAYSVFFAKVSKKSTAILPTDKSVLTRAARKE